VVGGVTIIEKNADEDDDFERLCAELGVVIECRGSELIASKKGMAARHHAAIPF